jgi:hypothetical protein
VQGHDSWFTRAEIPDGTWTQFTGQGQDDLTDDPLFIGGWPKIDARLSAGSPANNGWIDIGAPTVDIERIQRDSQPDVGAYEG